MNIAAVFDWFAQDCRRAAEHTDDPSERQMLLKLALQWEDAAHRSCDNRDITGSKEQKHPSRGNSIQEIS